MKVYKHPKKDGVFQVKDPKGIIYVVCQQEDDQYTCTCGKGQTPCSHVKAVRTVRATP